MAAGDMGGLVEAVSAAAPQVPESMTPALRAAVSAMLSLIEEAAADPASVCDARSAQWSEASRAARRRVVRMSLEMRMVVTVED